MAKKYLNLLYLLLIIFFLVGCATTQEYEPQPLNIEVLATMPLPKDPLTYILDLNTREGKFYHKNTIIQNWLITKIELGKITLKNKKTSEIKIVVWSERAKKWAGY